MIASGKTPLGPALSLLLLALAPTACRLSGEDEPAPRVEGPQCVISPQFRNAGDTGQAMVFQVDPLIASGLPTLSPASPRLDEFRREATLQRLSGEGVLSGAYVDVRNGLTCRGGYLAADARNRFVYSHQDPRFQEAMTYHYGDQYRAKLDAAGYLAPAAPVDIVAHCMKEDNAYFIRGHTSSGQQVQYVCLGDSVASPGASYADDGTVAIHELQHATTVNTYSATQELGNFWYDEAGALNEAISDFLTLTFFEPSTPAPFDPRVFSRWALGSFFPNRVSQRGAHRCPSYDADYPRCGAFAAGASGFSAERNTLSYAYPDGLGWPFANNYAAPGYLKSVFLSYRGQEEIHNVATLMTGTLWDIYEGIKANHAGASEEAHARVTKLAMEALKHAPRPTFANLSPVTFRAYAAELVASASLLGFSAGDQAAVTNALTARGLLGGTPVPTDWAEVGPGFSTSPGLRVIDHPNTLRGWITGVLGSDASVVTQGISTGLNGKLDRGEVAALWFDVRNVSAVTAGGIQVRVTSLTPGVTFLDENYNFGYLTGNEAEVHYGKINGSAIVDALRSTNATFHVPTGSTYFTTNPHYDALPMTALWVRVASTVAAGTEVRFEVRLVPSNGAAETLTYSAVLP